MPLTVASGLHPHGVPSLKTKVKPRSWRFAPPCPCCPHPCFPGKAVGKGKPLREEEKKVKTALFGSVARTKDCSARVKQSPGRRQMSPEELPLVNHGRACAAPIPEAGSAGDVWGRPSSVSPPAKQPRFPRGGGGSEASPTPRVGFGPCPGIAGGRRD